MESTGAECPSCGYAFAPDPAAESAGFAYSAWADLCLFVGAMASALGTLITLCAAVYSLAMGSWLMGFVVLPLAALNQLSFMIVILRLPNGNRRLLN